MIATIQYVREKRIANVGTILLSTNNQVVNISFT